MNFPHEWINEDNLNNKKLPKIEDFYSSLKLINNIRKKI